MAFLEKTEIAGLGLAAIGQNVLISEKASIYNAKHIHIGNNVRIDDFSILSPGANGLFIGDHVHIACYTSIIGQGKVTLEDFCNISSRVAIYSSNDDYSGNSLTGPTVPDAYKQVCCKDVVIGRHVIIGSGSVILPGVVLQEGACIGALSLVRDSCEPFGVYAGCPARRVSFRSRALLELEKKLLSHERPSHTS